MNSDPTSTRVGFDLSVTVIETPFVEDGKAYLIDSRTPMIVAREAVDYWVGWARKMKTRQEARAIVQEGMLDTLIWLTEANGGRWPFPDPPASLTVATAIAKAEVLYRARNADWMGQEPASPIPENFGWSSNLDDILAEANRPPRPWFATRWLGTRPRNRS